MMRLALTEAEAAARANLSRLAVWSLRLGIAVERIGLQQQARFDAFRDECNTERPHEVDPVRESTAEAL